MRRDPLFFVWLVHSASPEDSTRLRQFTAREITLDSVVEDEVRSAPGGVETVSRESHRLGDYFDTVAVVPESNSSSTSFRVLFRRRPDADRFWKDLMVRILQSIRNNDAGATTLLEYQGDTTPEVAQAG